MYPGQVQPSSEDDWDEWLSPSDSDEDSQLMGLEPAPAKKPEAELIDNNLLKKSMAEDSCQGCGQHISTGKVSCGSCGATYHKHCT